MFDIAFTELFIAAVIALVVVGPQRLPRLARQIGEWLGRLQRYVNDVKSDINRQMDLEELRRIKSEVTEAASDMESSFKAAVTDAEKEFDDISQSFDESTGTTSATDWDRIYEARRMRERIRDRRLERDRELGRKRPKRRHY